MLTGPLSTLCKPRNVCPLRLFPRKKREGIGGARRGFSLRQTSFPLLSGTWICWGRKEETSSGSTEVMLPLDTASFTQQSRSAPGWTGKIRRDRSGRSRSSRFVVTSSHSISCRSLLMGIFLSAFFNTDFKHSSSQPWGSSLLECCPWIHSPRSTGSHNERHLHEYSSFFLFLNSLLQD